MKSDLTGFGGGAIAAGLVVSLNFFCASTTFSTVQPTWADSMVQLVAESQELESMSAEAMQRPGSFWRVSSSSRRSRVTPLPSPPLDLSLSVWGIAGGQNLVDGADPNIISFDLSYTNQFTAASGVPLQINVTSGRPFYIAVLLDSTNFTGATWSNYTSSIIPANLGATPGWHEVWVGLRGLLPDATQTWRRKSLNLAEPPVLAITNPVGNVVSQPLTQIYGYCQESLAILGVSQ